MSFEVEIDENYELDEKKKNAIRIINYMADSGYFKNNTEYNKTFNFIVRGCIPEWLQKDIRHYYEKMKGDIVKC